MTPQQRSARLRIAGYTETADCMDMLLRIIADHGMEKLLDKELDK